MPFTTEHIEKLRPCYECLCKIKEFKEGYVKFFPQVGEHYFNGNHKKIMVVGKACNSWVEAGTSSETDKLFNADGTGIVNRKDQMKWVKEAWSRKKGKYSTSHSAFWTFSRKVADSILGTKGINCFYYIAWSNLYKVSPCQGGNPDQEDRNKQVVICTDIFKKELEILKPDFVFFFTSGWEKTFVDNFKSEDSEVSKDKWSTYEIESFISEITQNHRTVFVCTQHPQGKPFNLHLEAIEKALNYWECKK